MIAEPKAPAATHTADTAAAERWDVIVVGGGPAGCTAAWHLAGAGHRVLLLERNGYPRDKVCGDGLIADTLRALSDMQLSDSLRQLAHPVPAVQVYSPSRIHFKLPGDFFTIRRSRFDTFLANAAVARGAALLAAEAAAVQDDSDGALVRLRGAEQPLRARLVLLATGADLSLVSDRLPRSAHRPAAVAVRTYIRSSAEFPDMLVSFDRSILPGYAWIFPMGDGEYNVGCGVFYQRRRQPEVNLRKMLDRFWNEFPPAKLLRAAGQAPGPLSGARLRCGLRGVAPRVSRCIVAAGEMLGTTFPFTGEGIGKAMASGAICARQIAAALNGNDAALDAIAPLLDRELRPQYRGYEVAERWLSRGWLADLLARRVTRSPRLHERVTGILNETVNPQAVFSLRGLVPSLLG
ncbi:MAG TPA: NAD(P)/FAD-dependent oxidoreductase [Gemmatimonadales bacterium]|nr:NAD(P)/FAD-dependent oxidoreductase [Gemmatimonadales bacterium]